MSESTRTTVLEHRETHKHEKEYAPTAQSHGIAKSMVAHGTHEGCGGPKAEGKDHKRMAVDEETALDDERGSN